MVGAVAISIDKGIVKTKMELRGLSPTELSLLSTQLQILNNKVLNEIEQVAFNDS